MIICDYINYILYVILCLWSIYGYPKVRGGVARCLVTVVVQASVPGVVFRAIGFYNELRYLSPVQYWFIQHQSKVFLHSQAAQGVKVSTETVGSAEFFDNSAFSV